MKRFVAVALLIFASALAYGQAKPCEELKAEIAKKLDDKGVKSYTLDAVEKSKEDGEGKVVGTCDGGTKKIVYRREASAAVKPAAEKKAEKK